jgi:hypothetical protein
MRNVVLSAVVEILLAVATAGLLLAVLMPLLTRTDVVGGNDSAARAVITTVLVGAVAFAIFRPGGAIRQRGKR